MNYLDWNKILVNHYFNENMAGREVILYADSSLLYNLGEPYEHDLSDFIHSIKEGPFGLIKTGLCQNAVQIYNNWRSRYQLPPYVAYLVFFVLAAVAEGNFASHAYYPRFHQLLGEPYDAGMPPSFDRIDQLWHDLEKWTKEDKRETLGRFTARVRGGWVHVGLPLSQTLITDKERKKLPQIFFENGLDPTSPPSISLLSAVLRNSNLLENRTRQLLKHTNSETGYLRNSLLEIVQVELQAWNGIVQFDSQQITSIEGIKTLDKSAISFPHDQLISAILKVCLSYDPVSQEVKTTVRFKANKQFPENMLRFKRIKDNSIWTCSESNAYWSTELVSLTEGRLLDASTLNWEEGESFIDDNSCWQLKLRPAKVRIFVPGIREDLPGWLEINKIEATKGCYIACYSDYYFDVLTWGKEYCDGFSQLSAAGMPPQWSLFKLSSVNKSHPCIDELKLDSVFTLRTEGGIKSGHGNTYFKYAPPEIIAEGSGLEERLIMKVDGMQGVILNKNENNRYPIPENAPVDVPLMFELVSGQFVCRLTLVLEEPHLIHEYTLCPRDEFGNPAEKGFRFLIAGAHVFDDTGAIPPYPAQLPTYLANKIIFVGMKAGQISEWPDEMLPYDWDPVWGITKIRRDKWRVHYVGISAELILPGKQNRMNHKWKKWKRVILKNNVEIPNIKGLLQLWKAYVREAASL